MILRYRSNQSNDLFTNFTEDQYDWKEKLGSALEKLGKWLQGKYSAQTEEDVKEFEKFKEMLQDIDSEIESLQKAAAENGEEDAAAYGFWEGVRNAIKSVIINVVAQKVGGMIMVAMG